MNGFKAHLQASSPYSAGTDDQLIQPGAYRLILWKNLSFSEGWELDATYGALYARTPGLKTLRGFIWVTNGLTAGGVNTIKIALNGTLADVTTQTGGDVDAAVSYAQGTGGEAGRAGFVFGGVANMAAGDFVRVWYQPTGPGGAGSVTVNGHLAHTMFEGVDFGGGYSY